MKYRDLLPLGFRNQLVKTGRILVAAHPQLAYSKIPQHRGHAPKWIFVPMRHHNRIDALQSSAPKERRYHVLSHVESRPHSSDVGRAGQPSGIHQHGSAVGEREKNRIALTHVQNGHFQPPPRESRRKRVDNHQRCQTKHHDESRPPRPFRGCQNRGRDADCRNEKSSQQGRWR